MTPTDGAPHLKRPHRDLDVLIGNAFGTIVSGLVFCTLAWTIGQQFV
jgi:hypothetical protein